MSGVDFQVLLRLLPSLVSLDLSGTVVKLADLDRLAKQGQSVEMATLRSFSFSSVNASRKYCVQSILNIIHWTALEMLTITDLNGGGPGSCYSEQRDLESMQAVPSPHLPVLRSVELNRIICPDFVEHFDFTHLPTLDTISLANCTSPMAFFRLLLPSKGKANNNGVWPLLRVIKLRNIGAEEYDGLCNIILHRQACSKPIEAVELDPVSLKKFPEKVEWMKQRVLVQTGKHMGYLR
jgi:hypothetical protein